MIFFHYAYKNTVLHNMDNRVKLFCMVLFSLSAGIASSILDFTLLAFVLVIALLVSKLPLISLLKDIKPFIILIVFVFVINAFSIKGEPLPNFPINSVSIEGVIAGLTFACRLTIIIMICSVVTGTTQLLSFKSVIEWYLRPIPLIPETRVATMINLTFVLIPIILDDYVEMRNAQKARCLELRKNPIKRVMFIVFPLLINILRKADELIYAMEARCYSEERTRTDFKTNFIDWVTLALCIIIIMCVIFIF